MKATNPIVQARVEDVLRIRLDGAEGWDVRRYVAEKEAAGEAPWTIAEGSKPLSERQIRNYVTAADKLIDESCRKERKKRLRRHLAQRRSLYARSVNKGDERTALAVLRDLAELEGHYPPKKVAPTTPDGKNEYGHTLTDAERLAALHALYARVGILPGSAAPEGTADPAGPLLG
jgi:hypothetical protein